MTVHEVVIQGLNDDIAYEKVRTGANSSRVTINPPPEVTAGEIRALRQRLKMTQRTFAAIMGVSNKAVEAWEKGTNSPGGTARRLIGILIVDNTIPERYNIIVTD